VSVTRSGADRLWLGYRNRNVAQLPASPEIDVQNTRAVSFDDDEFERPQEVIAATRDVENGWLVAFVVVARWTGARRSELLDLERRQLDLDTAKITLDPGTTKNGDGRVFYLPPAALAALKAWDGQTRQPLGPTCAPYGAR
jgi:integrase